MNKYSDILISNGALTLSAREPTLVDSRNSIGQDVKHMIMESGLATQLIAQRSAVLRADIITKIELLVETDTRLVPGSIVLSETTLGTIQLTAATVEFGKVEVQIDQTND